MGRPETLRGVCLAGTDRSAAGQQRPIPLSKWGWRTVLQSNGRGDAGVGGMQEKRYMWEYKTLRDRHSARDPRVGHAATWDGERRGKNCYKGEVAPKQPELGREDTMQETQCQGHLSSRGRPPVTEQDPLLRPSCWATATIQNAKKAEKPCSEMAHWSGGARHGTRRARCLCFAKCQSPILNLYSRCAFE